MNNVKLTSRDIKILKQIFKIYVVRCRGILSTMCRSYVKVQFKSIKIMLMEDSIKSPDASLLCSINTSDQHKETAILAFDTVTVITLLERLLGNNADKIDITNRKFTVDIDISLMEGFAVRLLRCLWETSNCSDDWKFRLKKIFISREDISVYPSDLECVQIAFLIKTGKIKGKLKFFISVQTVLSIIHRLRSTKTDDQKKFRERLMEEKKKIKLEIDYFLMEMFPKPYIKREQIIPVDEEISVIKQWLIEGGESKISGANSPAEYKKAAKYLIGIGEENTSNIFLRLRQDEVEILTSEIEKIKEVNLYEFNAINKEMGIRKYHELFNKDGGPEYARKVLILAFGTHVAFKVLDGLEPGSGRRIMPFSFLQDKNPEILLNMIKNERPQTIAVILTYMIPLKASYILNELPVEIKSDVIIRMAEIDQRISLDVIREIERPLERRCYSIPEEMRGYLQ